MRKTLLTKALSLITSLALVISAFPVSAIGPAAMPAVPDFIKALTPLPSWDISIVIIKATPRNPSF